MSHTGSLLAVLLALALSSCAARRELVIESDPPGATVRLDQEIVGTTPYTTAFESFGTRRVTLYLEGFRAHTELVDLVAPWYARFPFDLFSEMLFPVGWRYRRQVAVVLRPTGGVVTAPDLEAVLGRAERLRRAGPEGPQPAQPPPRPEEP